MRVVGVKLFSLVWTAFLAAGCASTSSYQDSIATFAAASDKAATAFRTLDSDATVRLNDLRFHQAADAKTITIPAGNCTTSAQTCTLTFTRDGKQVPVYRADLMPETVIFMDRIHDYANALDALEKADARKDVEAAFGKVLNTAGALATVAGVPGAAIATAAEKPLSSAAGYVFGKYQDSMKREAFIRATTAVDAIIMEARPIISSQIAGLANAKLKPLAEAASDAQDAFNQKPSNETLSAAIDATNLMNAGLHAKLPDFYDNLAAAHAKLKAAVSSGGNIGTAIVAFQDLLQQAQSIKNFADQVIATKTAAHN